MKTPYRDGTTHVIFEPLDFIARLAEKQAGRGKAGRRGRLREEFGAMMPIYTLMGERKRPADGRCRARSDETARCRPTKRWFILPIRAIQKV